LGEVVDYLADFVAGTAGNSLPVAMVDRKVPAISGQNLLEYLGFN
jgi:hypothetical protein